MQNGTLTPRCPGVLLHPPPVLQAALARTPRSGMGQGLPDKNTHSVIRTVGREVQRLGTKSCWTRDEDACVLMKLLPSQVPACSPPQPTPPAESVVIMNLSRWTGQAVGKQEEYSSDTLTRSVLRLSHTGLGVTGKTRPYVFGI